MSFMGGGAECSSAGNPLSQFQKHVQDDKTLQRDRLVGRGPGGQMNGFRSQSANGPQDEVRDGLSLARVSYSSSVKADNTGFQLLTHLLVLRRS